MDTLLVATLSRNEIEELKKFIQSAASKNVKQPGPLAPAEQKDGADPEKTITLEDVRSRLAEARKADNTLDLAALFEKFGAKKLSDVDPENYADLLAALKDAR
jgi:hypothetical protein